MSEVQNLPLASELHVNSHPVVIGRDLHFSQKSLKSLPDAEADRACPSKIDLLGTRTDIAPIISEEEIKKVQVFYF